MVIHVLQLSNEGENMTFFFKNKDEDKENLQKPVLSKKTNNVW